MFLLQLFITYTSGIYEYQQEIALGIYYYWYRRHYHGSMEFDHVRNGGSEFSWSGSPTCNGLEHRIES